MCRKRKLKVNEGKSKVMHCTRMVDDSAMKVAVKGELLEEVECFKYFLSRLSLSSDYFPRTCKSVFFHYIISFLTNERKAKI